MWFHVPKTVILFAMLLRMAGAADAFDATTIAHRLRTHPDETVRQSVQQWHELTQDREWNDLSGTHSVRASFAGYEPDTNRVHLIRDDQRQINIPVNRLSPADQKVVGRLASILKQLGPIAQDVPPDDPVPHNPERERLLADWQTNRDQRVEEEDRKITALKQEVQAIVRKLETIRKARHQSERSREAQEAFREQQKQAVAALREGELKRRRIIADLEQDRRRILRKHPQPDDPELVQHKGRWLTPEEVAVLQRREAEHGTPRAAADRYMQQLIAKGKLHRAVYISTTHDGYRVNYQVGYTSPAGLVITRNGWVAMIPDAEKLWYVNLTIMSAVDVLFDGPF